ncbi:MAG: DHH family phosphoesterase [Minisyncoccales bacterium]
MSLSQLIFEKIKKAKNILISTHKNPDYDSIASCLALKDICFQLGKKATIISCQKISEHFFFLKGANEIQTIDYSNFDFSLYDLFVIPDTGSYDRTTGDKKIFLPEKMEYIIIDHHQTNNFNMLLRYIKPQASATCEIIYDLIKKWSLKIDKNLATVILTGILGDTVFLRYCENRKKTMKVVLELVKQGADMDFISENFFEQFEFDLVKLIGEFLKNLQKEEKFVWSAVDYQTYKKYHFAEGAREMAADLFFRGIKDADFGVAMLESQKNKIYLSFRSKKNTDVSKLAQFFGGGGHKNAAGATVEGDFKKSVKKVVKTIKEFLFPTS